MQNTVTRYVNSMPSELARAAVLPPVAAIGDRLSSQTLTSGALVIKAGGSTLTKAGAALVAAAKGVLVTKAANTDMAALVGTVNNATFNAWSFFVDSAGNLTSALGTAGTTLARVVLSPIPVGTAQIGFVIINPTGTGNFVGGTTALDDATVVPNAVYVNTVGAFDPTILV